MPGSSTSVRQAAARALVTRSIVGSASSAASSSAPESFGWYLRIARRSFSTRSSRSSISTTPARRTTRCQVCSYAAASPSLLRPSLPRTVSRIPRGYSAYHSSSIALLPSGEGGSNGSGAARQKSRGGGNGSNSGNAQRGGNSSSGNGTRGPRDRNQQQRGGGSNNRSSPREQRFSGGNSAAGNNGNSRNGDGRHQRNQQGRQQPSQQQQSQQQPQQPRRTLPRRDWDSFAQDRNLPPSSSQTSSSNTRQQQRGGGRQAPVPPPPQSKPAPPVVTPKTQVFLPAIISVSNLARLLGVKMRTLQQVMIKQDLQDTRPDAVVPFAEAELLALEFNLEAVANEEAAFDIYPRPSPATSSSDSSSAPKSSLLPLRPPIVTIMGHVDHGKTTLLDTLRKTSVAQGEAGGITQHIGAFSVPVGSSGGNKNNAGSESTVRTITFLDTPGHAAFTAMRSRGASVTDIIVLVVAADDGVMPQTEEVIALWKELSAEEEDSFPSSTSAAAGQGKKRAQNVQLVVALNKMDQPDADPEKVKRELLSAGVELEEFGGEVPCVEVSGKTGEGLDLLEETLATLAELAELRAERDGTPEGYVLESRVEKGRGNLATVLVKRGVLTAGDCLIAGTAWAKVRQILDATGKIVKKAYPGDPVLVTGWRELPTAGDELLSSKNESDIKKALANRKEKLSRESTVRDAEVISQARKLEAEEAEKAKLKAYEDRVRRRAIRAGDKVDPITGKPIFTAADALKEGDTGEEGAAGQAGEGDEDGESASTPAERKELLLIIKADFSGTVEAVVGALEPIGNKEAGVKIIASGVGEPTDSDVARAQAAGGAHIIGFNVQASSAIQKQAARLTPPVQIHCDSVIYRLMDHVSQQVAGMLEPKKEIRVTGEASVAQIFQINLRSRVFRNIAGCRVTNGVVSRNAQARILRGPQREVVFDGKVDTLKHVKKDVDEMRKGTECGMGFEGFEQMQPNDLIQCYNTVEVPRTL